MERKTLREVLPDPITSYEHSLFTEMYAFAPWRDLTLYPNLLDVEYIYNFSGSKLCSPLLLKLADRIKEDEEQAMEALALIILNRFSKKWEALLSVEQSNYNPVHNYNMSETVTRSDNIIGTKSGQRSNTSNASDVDTLNLSDVTTHGKTITDESYHLGFNSEEPSLSDKDEMAEGGTTSVAHTGTDGRVMQSTEQGTDSTNDSKSESESITTTRSGNIGVTTNQQMLQSEIELRQWNYWKQVYEDVDSVLALDVYDPCLV